MLKYENGVPPSSVTARDMTDRDSYIIKESLATVIFIIDHLPDDEQERLNLQDRKRVLAHLCQSDQKQVEFFLTMADWVLTGRIPGWVDSYSPSTNTLLTN